MKRFNVLKVVIAIVIVVVCVKIGASLINGVQAYATNLQEKNNAVMAMIE